MFSESDFIAARVRDAARYLNDALAQTKRNGLTFTVKVEERQPVVVVVEEQPR